MHLASVLNQFQAMGEAHFMRDDAIYPTLTVHIPWTENDYQIDIANQTQVACIPPLSINNLRCIIYNHVPAY